MNNVLKFLKEETIRIIPAIIFFVITFNLVTFTEKLMLRHEGADTYSYLTATLGGLIAGKFLLIVNTFPFIDLYPKKPLVYNITWKLFIYSVLIVIFRITERTIDLYFHHDSSSLVYVNLLHMLKSPIFWAIQIWVCMLFFAYIVASEFIRALGKKKIISLLFGE